MEKERKLHFGSNVAMTKENSCHGMKKSKRANFLLMILIWVNRSLRMLQMEEGVGSQKTKHVSV